MPVVEVPSFKQKFDGCILLIGFGSIGKALLPLLLRHLEIKVEQITIIDPSVANVEVANFYHVNFQQLALTRDNYEEVLSTLFSNSSERNLIINVANEVSSFDLISFAPKVNASYIDTVIEPWPGHYFNTHMPAASQTNYALREHLGTLRPSHTVTPTAISCCGANPGMVSWFVKRALVNLATDLGKKIVPPNTQTGWANLMSELGVKGIHIAERDTQQSEKKHGPGHFINSWSVEGCAAECLQPAELGWGTHEDDLPPDGHFHTYGSQAAIYLDAPGGKTRVRTWTPTHGEDFGFLITHNEAISIADYFTVRDINNNVLYRPTCHYAYHPIDQTIESLEELFTIRQGVLQENHYILSENDVTTGSDELGVLLYGHDKNAYWYGSQLSIEETRKLTPFQNATGLQVSSGLLAGIFYILKHPNEGLLETDEIDYEFCLNIQEPYLGKVAGYYTDWKPSNDSHDPWQFSNIRIT